MYKNVLTSKEKFHINLGLERIEKILKLLGNPEKSVKFIHVAGTNGKGSVCAILEEILTTAGFKTGKFTSPHLFSYCERISVNKQAVSEVWLDETIKTIDWLDKKHKIGLTEFEILTAAGFLYFKEENCDVAIIEVGLGGRLDSTNVIKKPLASIIASIGLEHTERLGNTIEEIAKEKAGIIKNGCPVVFLRENAGYQTLKQEAQSKKGVIYEAKKLETRGDCLKLNDKYIKFGLKGDFQGENAALALKTIEILNKNGDLGRKTEEETVEKALGTVKWAFRLEERYNSNGKILIDACHNPDGARVLREYLDGNYRGKKIKFIFGCLKNKDYKTILKRLFLNKEGDFDENKTLYFYEFNYKDVLTFEELPEEFKKRAKRTREAKQEVSNGEGFDLTVVCGSIYMLGEIFKNF